MSLKLVTGPATEPWTVAELKSHLRIDISDDDTLLSGMLSAAREYVEETARRALITQTWRLNLDAWPEGDEILLPRPPLQSVTSIVYKDSEGSSTTWSSSAYIVDTDSEPGRVVLAYGESWPSVTLLPANPIIITYKAGYGDDADDVPQRLRRCVSLLVGHWYEHREGFVEGTIREVPLAIDSLIWLNRAY